MLSCSIGLVMTYKVYFSHDIFANIATVREIVPFPNNYFLCISISDN